MTTIFEQMLEDIAPLASPCPCWVCAAHAAKRDDAVAIPSEHPRIRFEAQPFIPQERVNSSGWTDDFRTFDERFPSRY